MDTIPMMVTIQLHPFLPYVILALKKSYETEIWLLNITTFGKDTFWYGRWPLVEVNLWSKWKVFQSWSLKHLNLLCFFLLDHNGQTQVKQLFCSKKNLIFRQRKQEIYNSKTLGKRIKCKIFSYVLFQNNLLFLNRHNFPMVLTNVLYKKYY